MKLVLHRIYLPAATVGALELPDGLVLATLEDTLKNGGHVVDSCVAEGLYRLEPHSGSKYKNTWALVGEGVAHWATPEDDRETILFHGGDTVADTRGCILVGLEHYYAPDKPVDLSGCLLAMQALRAHLASEKEHELLIQRG